MPPYIPKKLHKKYLICYNACVCVCLRKFLGNKKEFFFLFSVTDIGNGAEPVSVCACVRAGVRACVCVRACVRICTHTRTLVLALVNHSSFLRFPLSKKCVTDRQTD